VHAPVHASWLNQIEIYFSIVQRKVLTPNDFPDLNAVAERLLDFQYYWATTGTRATRPAPRACGRSRYWGFEFEMLITNSKERW